MFKGLKQYNSYLKNTLTFISFQIQPFNELGQGQSTREILFSEFFNTTENPFLTSLTTKKDKTTIMAVAIVCTLAIMSSTILFILLRKRTQKYNNKAKSSSLNNENLNEENLMLQQAELQGLSLCELVLIS